MKQKGEGREGRGRERQRDRSFVKKDGWGVSTTYEREEKRRKRNVKFMEERKGTFRWKRREREETGKATSKSNVGVYWRQREKTDGRKRKNKKGGEKRNETRENQDATTLPSRRDASNHLLALFPRPCHPLMNPPTRAQTAMTIVRKMLGIRTPKGGRGGSPFVDPPDPPPRFFPADDDEECFSGKGS